MARDATIWLLVGMALFRNQSIQQVAKLFNISLGRIPASSSIAEARQRLGSSVLRWLYRKLGSLWSAQMQSDLCRGLNVYGIDGTTLTLEDTKSNVSFSEKPGSRKDKQPAARPQA